MSTSESFEDTPQNPFASPSIDANSNAHNPSLSSDAEQLRSTHIKHEASTRSFGLLYYLGGGILTLVGLTMLGLGVYTLFAPNSPGDRQMALFPFIVGVIYLALGICQIVVARGLRNLTQIGRIGATVFASIGLLGVPIGTLISCYLLYLLWSAKGKMIFSPEYKQVIQATPHIVHKTSKIVWAALTILLIVLVLGIVGAAFN